MIPLNPQSIQKLDKALKVINQRIARVGQTYGRNSNVYKSIVGQFETSDLKDFVGLSKSGDFKFKRSAIERALANGSNYQQLERVLTAAGYKVGKPGFLRQTKAGKTIGTVRDIRSRWRDVLDPKRNKTAAELDQEINVAVTLSDDFKSLVYECFDTFGEDEMKKEYPNLFSGKGKRGRKLTKAEFEMYKREMIRKLVGNQMEIRKAGSAFVDSFANKP